MHSRLQKGDDYIKIIVAVDNNYAIGRNNELLCHLKSDLKRFKSITEGSIIVMGRKTLESLPNGNPLPNRTNIVLTRDTSYRKEGVIVMHSIDYLVSYMRLVETLNNISVYVIGGGEIYKQLLEFCELIYVTKVNFTSIKKADTYFPNLDKMPEWKVVEKSPILSENGLQFEFLTYIKQEHYMRRKNVE